MIKGLFTIYLERFRRFTVSLDSPFKFHNTRVFCDTIFEYQIHLNINELRYLGNVCMTK